MPNPIRFINPASLLTPKGFTHITIGAAQQVGFISGQVAYDEKGNIVGVGDLAKQTRQVFENLSCALRAIGADFNDVLKFTFFVKNLSEESVATIRQVRADFLSLTNPPASTMVGVAALAKQDLLLEVEAYVAASSSTD